METTVKQTTLALLLGGLFLAAGFAQAKEGGDQYPNGAENWFAGAVPPPGDYFINYFGHWSGKLKDGNGDNANVGGSTPKLDATFDALRWVHVTNKTLLGASYAWHVIVPVVDLDINIAPLGGKAGKTGLGDITVNPIILAWHGPEWHTVAALDINLPTGEYDKNDPRKSIGANYYSFEPLFGVSYLGKNGWEASAKFMYNIKTKNDDTNYQSGDEFHVDYLIGKNFGNWAVGLSGYYLKQVSDDKLNGVKVGADGNRGQVFSYGPSIKYKTASGTQLIGYWQHETNVENRFGGDKVWFKLIMPF